MDKQKQEQIEERIINIKNTSYKFTKATLIGASKTIEFLKQNKKIYRCLVIYLAMCLMPSFARIGKDLIYEFIIALSQIPSEMRLSAFYNMLLTLTKYITLIVISCEIIKKSIANTVSNLLK